MDETIYLMLRVGTLAMALALAGSAAAQTAPPTCRTPECVKAQLSAPYQAQQRAQWANEVAALGGRMLQDAKSEAVNLSRMTPAQMTDYVARVKAEEARITELDVKLGLAAPDWTAVDAKRDATVAKEVACRADAKCMAQRQVDATASSICANLGNIRVLTARIAAERANPSGVVDLADLHSSGEDIQIAQANVAGLKVQYAKLTGKPFDASVCR